MSNHQISNRQQVIKFRYTVLAFFLCLSLPFAMIVYYGFQKFESEKSLEYQLTASAALAKINDNLARRLKNEQTRSPNDYYYFKAPIDESKAFNQLGSDISQLARLREPHYLHDLWGLVGYFNIRHNSKLNVPSLPYRELKDNSNAKLTISKTEIEQRTKVKNKIKASLIKAKLMLDDNSSAQHENKLRYIKLTSEFQFIETPEQEFIFYRSVEYNEQPLLQGFVVNKKEYLLNLLSVLTRRAGFDHQMLVQLKDSINRDYQWYNHIKLDLQGKKTAVQLHQPIVPLTETPIFEGKIDAPFEHLSLKFTTDALPLGAASRFVVFFVILLTLVIISGCFGFYWLGMKQIGLAEQRMNFVSSVSHELKTPLTSILMYSEMLKSEMIEEKDIQMEYYDFIYTESERLSRLINNVLQLSNLSQKAEVIKLEQVLITTLKDIAQSKVSTLISTNNFQLNFKIPDDLNTFKALVDLDAFSQIMINLVDNSVKFFNTANINDEKRQQIDISFSLVQNTKDKLRVSVRDFGPGISSSQHKKIFELFYRCGNELTRTTSGTGIGLALVNELMHAQDGEVLVKRQDQGVSFDLIFNGKLDS